MKAIYHDERIRQDIPGVFDEGLMGYYFVITLRDPVRKGIEFSRVFMTLESMDRASFILQIIIPVYTR